MEYIKQSTGTTVTVGPFPSMGGVTSVTSLAKEAVSNAGGGGTCRLMQGGTSTEITVSNWEHYGNGYYALWLSGSSVGTVGSGVISFTSTTPDFMPVWKDILVQSANVYDSLVGATDNLTIGGVVSGVTINDFSSQAKSALGGVSIAGASHALRVTAVTTSVGSVVSGVTINDYSSQAKSTLGGVTVAGVSNADKVVNVTGNVSGNVVGTVQSVIGGVTINSFSSQAKGALGGVTIAGVSNADKVDGSIGSVVSGVTINSFSSQAKGVLGGVTIAGVSLVYKVDDFTSTAKGTLGGVTVAGVSAVYKVVPAGVTNIFDGAIEPGYSLKESIRLQNAQQFGVSVGGGGTTCAFKDLSGSTYRIKATMDSGGNRISIDALDASDAL